MVAPFSVPGRIAFGISLMQCMQRMQSSALTRSSLPPCRAPAPWSGTCSTTMPLHVEAVVQRTPCTCVLVDAQRALPGADDGHVGAGDGGHAVVGAAGDLDLELVGPHRAVQLVLEGAASGRCRCPGCRCRRTRSGPGHAAAGGPQGGAGAAQVEARLAQGVEALLQILAVWVPSRMMSPVEPCMLVRPLPYFSQMSHSLRSVSVV